MSKTNAQQEAARAGFDMSHLILHCGDTDANPVNTWRDNNSGSDGLLGTPPRGGMRTG